MNKKIKADNPNQLLTIKYTELGDLQGDFKTLTKENLEKLKRSIIKYGIFLPKFVWYNKSTYWTLDGNQSKKALQSLSDEYEIPKIPIVKVKAKNKKEAIEKILIINSRFGDINRKTELFNLYELEIEFLEDITIPELDILKAYEWNPDRTYANKNDGINELIGYGLQSFWKDIRSENALCFPYQIELPYYTAENKALVRQKYSRTNLEEIERIIRTYMRKGEFFLESCCGWSTFSSSAKYFGYSGIAIDIWEKAIQHSLKQIDNIKGMGKIEVKDMDAMDMSFDDNYFDFIYCNPPFMDKEKYSGQENDIADKNFNFFQNKFLKLMNEHYRVLKKECLCIITINDQRYQQELIPLQKHVIDWGLEAGFKLWDFVIAEVLSQKIRLRKKDYEKRRTVKCHEYVIIFKKT